MEHLSLLLIAEITYNLGAYFFSFFFIIIQSDFVAMRCFFAPPPVNFDASDNELNVVTNNTWI